MGSILKMKVGRGYRKDHLGCNRLVWHPTLSVVWRVKCVARTNLFTKVSVIEKVDYKVNIIRLTFWTGSFESTKQKYINTSGNLKLPCFEKANEMSSSTVANSHQSAERLSCFLFFFWNNSSIHLDVNISFVTLCVVLSWKKIELF